jgi:ABC-type bacteriocin/lantibiotic exporter with double-glycine peptidase domain
MGAGAPRMRAADAPVRGQGARAGTGGDAKKPKPKFSAVWPEIKALVKPRRGLLAMGFALMIVNRAASLVLPIAFRPLVDLVFVRGRMDWLLPIVGAVLGATILQGITSYALTQTLSKAGWRGS